MAGSQWYASADNKAITMIDVSNEGCSCIHTSSSCMCICMHTSCMAVRKLLPPHEAQLFQAHNVMGGSCMVHGSVPC